MLVEFVGCTGSGKTTLIAAVKSRLAKTTRVLTAHDLVASRIGLGSVLNPTGRNLIEELVGFPYCLRALPRQRAFLGLAIRLFARNSHLSFTAIHNLRSLERKIGVYEIAVRSGRDAIVLVDEGPMQAAHMFAFAVTAPTPNELARFAYLLPLPDLIVYVTAPVETLLRRTLERPDPPRQMHSTRGGLPERYVRSAAAIFDQLIQAENLRDRVLIANSPDYARQAYSDLADRIAASILDRRTAVLRPGGMPELSQAT